MDARGRIELAASRLASSDKWIRKDAWDESFERFCLIGAMCDDRRMPYEHRDDLEFRKAIHVLYTCLDPSFEETVTSGHYILTYSPEGAFFKRGDEPWSNEWAVLVAFNNKPTTSFEMVRDLLDRAISAVNVVDPSDGVR